MVDVRFANSLDFEQFDLHIVGHMTLLLQIEELKGLVLQL
jgi:hypothetical protein